jgi:hypothetical protein
MLASRIGCSQWSACIRGTKTTVWGVNVPRVGDGSGWITAVDWWEVFAGVLVVILGLTGG